MVGRLIRARRAISASVTRSMPKSTTQLAAAARIRSPMSVALLIDSICNTVTHAASDNEVECLGRPGGGQTPLRRNQGTPLAGSWGHRFVGARAQRRRRAVVSLRAHSAGPGCHG